MYRFTFYVEPYEKADPAPFVDWFETEAQLLMSFVETGRYACLRNLDPFRDSRIPVQDVKEWRLEFENIRALHRRSVIDGKLRGPKGSKESPRFVLETQGDKLFAKDLFYRRLGATIDLFKIAETKNLRIMFSGA